MALHLFLEARISHPGCMTIRDAGGFGDEVPFNTLEIKLFDDGVQKLLHVRTGHVGFA